MRAIAIALLVWCGVARADDPGPSTARHLLAGVRAFRDAQYEEALVELRVVARAPDAPADLAFYLGPTLYKLGRYREALAVFVTSRAPGDGLTRFYLGQTYYQLKLYRKARAVFAALRASGLGPTLDEATERYVAAIDAAYRTLPERAALDAYLDDGRASIAREPVVAAELLDEARAVEELIGIGPRHAELLAAIAEARSALDKPAP